MLHLKKLVKITLLASVLFSPAAMAQELLGTQANSLSQHVPVQCESVKEGGCIPDKIKTKPTNPKPPSTDTAKKPPKGKVTLGTPTCKDTNGNVIKCY
ncbi:hypothetical protein [Brunnivagina elsteri]|uniref:Secreted protein n=1 Tax=Brunnivagina elsteri CCALA 953 TaxID=987040 RepID=A0A2A2TI31_9CYAN|nr:hypothetical protein [Calothrix elsteri]PAX53392.1 hypothetical protein CK510_14200 [Calothrix elsteri CCALA 953]